MDPIKQEEEKVEELKHALLYGRAQYLETNMTQEEYFNLIGSWHNLLEYAATIKMLEVI